MCRIDNLILEAIINLKEPTGSNKTAIATYIEVGITPLTQFLRLFDHSELFVNFITHLAKAYTRDYVFMVSILHSDFHKFQELISLQKEFNLSLQAFGVVAMFGCLGLKEAFEKF